MCRQIAGNTATKALIARLEPAMPQIVRALNDGETLVEVN